MLLLKAKWKPGVVDPQGLRLTVMRLRDWASGYISVTSENC